MSSRCNCRNTDEYLPQPATIVRSEPMTELERFFELRLDSGRPLGHGPGQFVTVSLPGIGEAPISVSYPAGASDRFELVVRRVARLSNALHQLPPGSKVGVRGPFGTTFPVEEMRGQDLLFICGGIGLVPVRSAILHVLSRRNDYGHITILYGTKSPADRLFSEELKAWGTYEGVTCLETVDRADAAWKGNVGVITTLIPRVTVDPARVAVIICGPPVMYKFVLVELFTRNVPADRIYISLERRMKCGIGKCGHCQINGLYTCIDGPVFRYSDVADVQEAL